MKVKGTVTINFEVNIDADDISTNSMSMYESDVLIAKAIDDILPHGCYVEGDIHVVKTIKTEKYWTGKKLKAKEDCMNNFYEGQVVVVEGVNEEELLIDGAAWINKELIDKYFETA